jgi:hypothetical protein
MLPVLKSCLFLVATFSGLLDQVRALIVLDSTSPSGRPEFARQAVAKRLKSALRIAGAFLRRMLLVMALEIEPTLVDTRKPLPARPKAKKRKTASQRGVRFTVFEGRFRPVTQAVELKWEQAAERRRQARYLRRARARQRAVEATGQSVPLVAMAPLYRRLDWMAQVAANPMKKARSVAVGLARFKKGRLVTPDPQLRIPGRWGTEASMLFDAMGYQIPQLSQIRPPPQAPRQRYWPTVWVADW